MSTNPERSVSYVLTKSVAKYMEKDVLILDQDTQTREAARMLRHYETDDVIVSDENNIPIGLFYQISEPPSPKYKNYGLKYLEFWIKSVLSNYLGLLFS